MSADVIVCVWGNIFGGWLRTKFSCELHQRLNIMHQSFLTTASPKPLSRAGIAWKMYCGVTFTLSP